jgi:hypothetical protein
MDIKNEVTKHMFLHGTDDLASSVSNSASDHPNCSDVKLTSVVFLNSSNADGLLDGHTINTPHKGEESEVIMVQDSLGLAGSQVHSVKENYCNMLPRQNTCEVINNCLVEYEKPRNLLHKNNNAKFFEGNSHLSDNIEPVKSENMKTQKEAKLYLVASCDRAETNTTQATISNSNLSDSRDVTSEELRAKIDENNNLSDFQKEQLCASLLRYKNHLTK